MQRIRVVGNGFVYNDVGQLRATNFFKFVSCYLGFSFEGRRVFMTGRVGQSYRMWFNGRRKRRNGRRVVCT